MKLKIKESALEKLIERRNILKKINKTNKYLQKYNIKKGILMKAKQIYVSLIALTFFSEFYSISVSADSIVSNSQDVITPLRILPRMNVEFEGGSSDSGYWTNTSNLTFIQNTASGVLYYDQVNHKYVFAQTRGPMGAAI